MPKMTDEDRRKLMGRKVSGRHVYRKCFNGDSVSWSLETCSPFEGWIVGFRYYQNGVREYQGYESGHVFDQRGKPTPVTLVALHPRQKPIPCDGLKLKLEESL